MDDLITRMMQARHWAVLGVSTDESKFGTRVYRALKAHGRQVVGVNPRLTALDGEPIYPDLAALPDRPEVVNVVVPPAAARGILEECLRLGIRQVWFQPGAEDPAAIAWAQGQGIEVVSGGPCVLTCLVRQG
jgi:predicted CoA-binding protein